MTQSPAVADRLRDEILRGRYQPGDRLPSERELDEAFETRNATRGSNLVHLLMRIHREQIVSELKRARAGTPGASLPGDPR
jgi:DNA-binding transcriptional MocR family regulator